MTRASVASVASLAFLASLASLASCGGASDASDSPPPLTTKIAFAADFAGYHGWTSFACGIGSLGNDHLQGPRRVYLNRLPPPGATAFPIGTIFVKESGDGPPETRHVFASVKRGGGFNATGAVNWEWFELANGPDDRPRIVWRGFGPSNGDAYGGDATGGCNGCHDAPRLDYAWSAQEFGLLAK
jgi:hypothetical protein